MSPSPRKASVAAVETEPCSREEASPGKRETLPSAESGCSPRPAVLAGSSLTRARSHVSRSVWAKAGLVLVVLTQMVS